MVERRIDALLRGSEASGRPLRAEARVDALAEAWRLQVVLRDEQRGRVEQRELEAVDCPALAEAFALIVAVHVDALRAEANAVELQQPRTAPAVRTAATATSSAPVVPSPAAAPPRRASPASAPRSAPPVGPALGGLLRIEGGAELGMLPGVAGGIGMTGGLVGRAWRVELGASAWPARSASVARVGIRLDSLVGRARVCWAPAVARWHVPVCGGGEAGGLRGIGTDGVARPRAQWAPWGAVTASVGVAWSPRPWIGPYAAVEAVGALSQPRFVVADRTVVRAEAAGIRAWIGVELKFASRTATRGKTQRRAPKPSAP